MPSEPTVFVNGSFVPASAARISVFDRGFLLADAVYEVIAVLEGRLVDCAGHLARLDRSLSALSIPRPMTDTEFSAVQRELVERSGIEEGIVYCQVSRGPAERDLVFPASPTPTVVMFTQARSILANPKAETGLRVITVDDLRWRRRDIKTVSLLASAMAKQQAVIAGVDDAWLVEDGLVTEGCSSNAFIVDTGGTLLTHHLDRDILHGITRRAVLSMAETEGLRFEERAFSVDEAYQATEAFSTSAASFVLPVVEIDGHRVGTGRAGSLTARLRRRYIDFARAAMSDH